MNSKLIRLIQASCFAVVFAASSANAAQVRVHVVDESGANIANVLVVVRLWDAEKSREILRELTGTDGFVSSRDLEPGLYEAKGIFPYSGFASRTRYFLVTTQPKTIEMTLKVKPLVTQVRCDVVDLAVRVIGSDGRPISNAWVIGRETDDFGKDPDDLRVASRKTDMEGRATIEVTTDGAEVTVLYGDKFSIQPIDISSPPTGSGCASDAAKRSAGRSLTVHLP
jgi:hypothetical protein